RFRRRASYGRIVTRIACAWMKVVEGADGLVDPVDLRRMLNHSRVWEQTSQDDEQHNASQNPPLTRQRIGHNGKASSALAQEEPREQTKKAHGIHGGRNGQQQSCEWVCAERSGDQ